MCNFGSNIHSEQLIYVYFCNIKGDRKVCMWTSLINNNELTVASVIQDILKHINKGIFKPI